MAGFPVMRCAALEPVRGRISHLANRRGFACSVDVATARYQLGCFSQLRSEQINDNTFDHSCIHFRACLMWRRGRRRFAGLDTTRIAGLRRVRRRVIVGILETESDFHFARVPAGSQRLRGNVANGLRGTGSSGVIVTSGARSTMSGSDSLFADDPPPPQHTRPTA